MAVQTEKETLDMLRTLIDFVEKKANATGVKLRELRDRELSHKEMQQWLKFLSKVTQDGQVAPRSITLNAEDKDKIDYVFKQAELNGKSDLFKELKNDDNTITVLTNDEGFDFFVKQHELFDISHPERAGEIREVSLSNDIAAATDDRSKTIIRNLSEDQYLALTKKVYKAEDRFTFVAMKKNENGKTTYDIMVDTKNYMNGNRVNGKFGANDIYSFIIADKVFHNQEYMEAIREENSLMERVLNYNEEGKFYVSQLYKGDQFMIVEKNKVTIVDRNNNRVVIDKAKIGKENFQINVLRYWDKFSVPFEVTENICKNRGYDVSDIENLCLNHAKSGNDRDFLIIKEGKLVPPIPVSKGEDSVKMLANRKDLVLLIKSAEAKAFDSCISNYVKDVSSYVEKNILDKHYPEMDKSSKESFIINFEKNLVKNIKEFRPDIKGNFEKTAQKSFNETVYKTGLEKKDISLNIPAETNKTLPNIEKAMQEEVNKSLSRLSKIKESYKEDVINSLKRSFDSDIYNKIKTRGYEFIASDIKRQAAEQYIKKCNDMFTKKDGKENNKAQASYIVPNIDVEDYATAYQMAKVMESVSKDPEAFDYNVKNTYNIIRKYGHKEAEVALSETISNPQAFKEALSKDETYQKIFAGDLEVLDSFKRDFNEKVKLINDEINKIKDNYAPKLVKDNKACVNEKYSRLKEAGLSKFVADKLNEEKGYNKKDVIFAESIGNAIVAADPHINLINFKQNVYDKLIKNDANETDIINAVAKRCDIDKETLTKNISEEMSKTGDLVESANTIINETDKKYNDESRYTLDENQYSKTVRKWYEESANKMVLAGDGDKLVTAYIKELAYTEDQGPLADIPDTIDGTMKEYENVVVEHYAIDEKGNCLNEDDRGKNIKDILGYDERNMIIDEKVSNINTARMANQNMQKMENKIYKKNSVETPSYDER